MYSGLVWLSWESCLLQLSSPSVPKNLYFQVTSQCAGDQDLVLSLDVTHESKSLLLGVWQHKDWLTVPDRGLFNGVEESLSGDIFSNR